LGQIKIALLESKGYGPLTVSGRNQLADFCALAVLDHCGDTTT
jgi:hypothetical protein